MKFWQSPRTNSRDSSYGETNAATTKTPWRSSRLARCPTRWMCASRSARLKPVFGKRFRILSPSRYSTLWPRPTSTSATRCAIVLLPEPESPVNQSTAGRTSRFPSRTRSHIRSWSQKSPILDVNSTTPTASDSMSRRVKANTSREVATVPRTRHETALTRDLVCVS